MLRFTFLEIIAIIVVGIFMVYMIIRLFFNQGGDNKANMALDPYTDEYEGSRNIVRRKEDVSLEVDDDDDEIPPPKTFDDIYDSMKKRKLINRIIGVILLIVISIALYFIFHAPVRDLRAVYVGEFFAPRDVFIRKQLMKVDGIEKPAVEMIFINEQNGISDTDLEGRDFLDTVLEEGMTELFIVDQYFLNELSDEFSALEDFLPADADRDKLVVKKGHIVAIDITGDERIVDGFTETPEKVYMAVANSSGNNDNAISCIKFYVKVIE
ncbi:MAG: hypothetical protein JXQ23_06550 [Clostridia bacterium]|nr:hypothetical protein [Clostridia bacterium]